SATTSALKRFADTIPLLHASGASFNRVAPRNEEDVAAALLALPVVTEDPPEEGEVRLVGRAVGGDEGEDVASDAVAVALALEDLPEDAKRGVVLRLVRLDAPEQEVPVGPVAIALVFVEQRHAMVHVDVVRAVGLGDVALLVQRPFERRPEVRAHLRPLAAVHRRVEGLLAR